MANLLLVEDDASVRQIVMLQLSLVGYDVRAAEDAGQARRMMEEKTPDLAILDIMLPGEDGFSLAETMMERAVPVLFLTAKTAVSDRVRGLRMGAEDYMLKPFEPEELLARVGKHPPPHQEGADAFCFRRAGCRSAVPTRDEGRARSGADRAGI